MQKRRVMALILAMTLIISSVYSFADTLAVPAMRDSGTNTGALDSGYMAEPNTYSEEYAAYLAKLDEENRAKGVETNYWMDYMVKWGKAIPYENLPDDYEYQNPNMRGRAATTTVGALPMGAKIVDPTTRWGSEPMVWVKVSNQIFTAKSNDFSYDASTSHYEYTSSDSRSPISNNVASYFYSERAIASLPHYTSLTPGTYDTSMLWKWLNEVNSNYYLGKTFFTDVLSADIRKNMSIAVLGGTLTKYRRNNDKTGLCCEWLNKWVGLPLYREMPFGNYNDEDQPGLAPYAELNKLHGNTSRYAYFPIVNTQGSISTRNQRNDSVTVDLSTALWSYANGKGDSTPDPGYLDIDGNGWNISFLGGNDTTIQKYAAGIPNNRSALVKPVIALKNSTVVSAVPDASGVYTMITADFCDTPQLIQTVDATLGTILTAYSPNAASIKLFNGSTQMHSVSGTSLVYKVGATGTYKATASKGSYSTNSNNITISNVTSAKPIVTISYQDAAQAWAASVKVFFSVSEVANGSALKPGAAVTVAGPGGAVTATHTSNGNYNFTATANGAYKVTATISGQSANASTSVSKIDVTVPAAPTIAKFPNTTYHKDNVIVTIAGGSDAGSGIKGYQYKIGSGGAWTNGASVSVPSTNTVYGRTVDNVGKVSAEASIAVNINRTVPSGTVTVSTTSWTKGTVTLTFTASDIGGSGVKRVRAVGGSWANGSTCTQNVSTNGTYYFEVENNAGGVGTASKAITNIDTTAPVVGDITFTQMPRTLRTIFARELEIRLQATDAASGVGRIEYQLVEDGSSINPSAWLTYNDSARPRIQHNFTGVIAVRAVDSVGNTSPVKTTDIVIEDTPPTASHMLTPDSPTDGNVTIKVTATDTSGIASIQRPDGTVAQGGYAEYTVSANGSYLFIVTDKCGNTLDYTVAVSSIDTTPPTATHTLLPDGWTNGDVVIELAAKDEESGIVSIQLPDYTVESRDTVRFTAKVNGKYPYQMTNGAGIVQAYEAEVTGIDRVKPEITGAKLVAVPAKLRTLFREKVELHTTAADDASGVNRIGYQVCSFGEQPNDTAWKRYDPDSPPSWSSDMLGSVFVRSVDNAGNPSIVTELPIQIDMTPPSLELEASHTALVNGDVVLTARFADTGSGMKSVTLPDGTVVADGLEAKRITYTATRNGVYSFSATDIAGNTATAEITVAEIDRIAPTITRAELTPASGGAWFKTGVQLTVEAEDDYSGIDRIEYKAVRLHQSAEDIAWQTYDVANPPRWNEDIHANVLIRVLDRTGNISTTELSMLIDLVAPALELTASPGEWTNQDVVLTARFSDAGSGIKSVTLPDGRVLDSGMVLDSGAASYTVSENGTYPFSTSDTADNPTTDEITVDWIDRTAPNITRFELAATEDGPIRRQLRGIFPQIFSKQVGLLLEAEDDYSGVEYIEYQIVKDGELLSDKGWKRYRAGVRLEEEAKVTVYARAVDHAANSSPEVSRDAILDGSGPVAIHTITPEPGEWTNGVVVITVQGTDSLTEVVSITSPDGTVIPGNIARYTVQGNGSYTFLLTNAADVSTVYTVMVANIDPDMPTPPKIDPPTMPDSIEFPWSSAPNHLKVFGSAVSGISKYKYNVTKLWPLENLEEMPGGPAKLLAFARMASGVEENPWNESDGEIVIHDEGVFGVQVRTVSISGSESQLSAYTVKNDFTAPTAEVHTTRNSITLIASDELSGMERIICEHGEMLGGKVICPMNSSEVHHYDVYDIAGNIAPVDVDFVYRSAGEWLPGGEPQEPGSDENTDAGADERPNMPEISITPSDELPPLEDAPTITLPTVNDGGTTPNVDTGDTPLYQGFGDTDNTNPYDTDSEKGHRVGRWYLTDSQYAVLRASISLLLLLIAALAIWAALQHDKNTKKPQGRQD